MDSGLVGKPHAEYCSMYFGMGVPKNTGLIKKRCSYYAIHNFYYFALVFLTQIQK